MHIYRQSDSYMHIKRMMNVVKLDNNAKYGRKTWQIWHKTILTIKANNDIEYVDDMRYIIDASIANIQSIIIRFIYEEACYGFYRL